MSPKGMDAGSIEDPEVEPRCKKVTATKFR
jgi:hypothetical protein